MENPSLSAKTADTDGWKSYEYYAVDQHGTRSKPVKFRIRVSDAKKPTAPENVMAMEEGFTANPLDRVTNTNKVVTSWMNLWTTVGRVRRICRLYRSVLPSQNTRCSGT